MWPLAIATALQAGVGAYNAFAGNNFQGLSVDDQRWLADFQWKMANRQQSDAEATTQFNEDAIKNAVQWRVEDAQKAGISPLAALGVSPGGVSSGPVQSVFPSGGGEYAPTTASKLSDVFGKAGQGIERAMAMAQSHTDRVMDDLKIRKQTADTEFAESQAKLSKINVKKASLPPPNPAIPTTTQFFKKPDGSIIAEPSKEFKDAVGSSMFDPGAAAWWIENKAIPFITGGHYQSLPYDVNIGTETYHSTGIPGVSPIYRR